MRIPPDVTALLIKVRDFAFVFGPILLIALTLIAAFLTAFTYGGTWFKTRAAGGSGDWPKFIRTYFEAGAPDREKLKALFEYGFTVPPPRQPAAGVGKATLEAGAISASIGAVLTGFLLSPLLGLVRLGGGLVFFILGRWLYGQGNFVRTKSASSIIEKQKEQKPFKRPAATATPLEPASTLTPNSKIKARDRAVQRESLPGRFWQLWSREFDYYLGRVIYNFFLAALVTIFVPLRIIEAWFGSGQWTGPLLVPLVGLLLRPGAPGTETALVLALFIKGAGTGSGAAALLAFPLLNLIGLAQRWQYYGVKPTLKFTGIVWLVASGTGLILEIIGINANV